jgi:hypothetical protein
MSMPEPVPGATAVVTGATAGIGAELARLLAAAGHDLLLVARTAERLSASAEALMADHGVSVTTRPCDLSDPAAARALGEELADRDISVLCLNAGQGVFGAFAETDPEQLSGLIKLNVLGVSELAARLLPGMVERGRGYLLLVGSTGGNQPLPGFATYAATKAFVNSLAEALHEELRGSGVTCTLLAPGPVKTEFADRSGASKSAEMLPGMVWVTAEQVARAGLAGLAAGRRRVVPGLSGRVLDASGRLTPNPVVLPVVHSMMRKFVARAERPASHDAAVTDS